ncbi:MAG: 50S ribosomal protein L23 [Candidatus Omnitrophota bacterium]
MPNPYDIIKTLIHSEKGSRLESDGCYQFYVSRGATKVDIKNAVEKIYKVKVRDVNTVVVRGKMKRIRMQLGKQPDWKKAYVRLAENQKIEIAK